MDANLLDRMQTPVATLDASGVVQWANRAFAALVPSAPAGMRLDELFEAFVWTEVTDRCADAPYTATLARDGRLFSTVFSRHEAEFVAEIVEHRVDDEIPDATQTLRMLSALEHSGETIIITDRNARIVYVNPQFERVMGYTRDEVIGGHNSMWRSGHHDAAFYEAAWLGIQRGETWRGELVNRRRDGTLVHEATSISRITSRAGEVLGYVEVKRDVTAERELEQALAHAQRMESIGTLAGGVAHDFNNVLQTVLGNAELLLEALADSDRLRGPAAQIRDAAEHSAGLTRQLLAFARRQVVAPRALDTSAELERVIALMQRLVGAGIRLRWAPEPDLWPVHVDPAQFGQIVTNICINARDAIGDVGTIDVTARNLPRSESTKLPIPTADHGDYVCVTIRDSGPGMDPEVLPRVFEPFFTTKPQGEGTGLGLATVYGIVTQHGGHVFADSAPGEGTTLRVYLPRHGEAAETEEVRAAPQTQPADVSARLLVVEDERSILDLLHRQLARAGYGLRACSGPREALEALEEGERFDLLISDVIMPEMNGRDLAEAVRARQPDIGVLFMSGYTADVLAEPAAEAVGAHFIQKPFQRAELLARIEAILAP